MGPGVRTTGFQIPDLLLTSYVTLRWFWNFPEALPPRFLQRLTEMIQVRHLACLALWEDEESLVSLQQVLTAMMGTDGNGDI